MYGYINDEEGVTVDISCEMQNQLSHADRDFTFVVDKNHDIASRKFGLQCVNTMEELSSLISSTDLAVSKLKDDGGSESLCVKSEDSKTEKVTKSLLVELHFFPGFNHENPTPLPANLKPTFVLEIVLTAQTNFCVKPSFRDTHRQFLLSESSQIILQDCFWWYFCYRFQSKTSGTSQGQLFDRVASEYTKLLMSWTGSQYEDKLLKNYPDLISQAVYTTFYHAFSASYLHFNADFCDDLLAQIHLWMVGARPVPRLWEKWNFDSLHPVPPKRRDLSKYGSNVNMEGGTFQGRTNLSGASEISRDTGNFSESFPIKREMQQITSALGKHNKGMKKNSCVVGCSTIFHKVAFDVYGRSPLVEHFLATQHLLKHSGSSTLIQRTEIRTLPPLLAETYLDLVEDVRCKSRQRSNRYSATLKYQEKEHRNIKKQNEIDQNKFCDYADRILSNDHEVRKMSAFLRTDERN